MNFPEQVTFKLLDSKTKTSIKNVTVSLILYAHKKNDYYVGPKISDIKGIINFTKNDCIKEIENSKKFYLMDYVSTLEQCSQKISIKIKSKEEIEFAVRNMRQLRDVYQKYWNCSEEYLNALDSTNNDKYVIRTYDFFESELWGNNILNVELEKKL